ncbi:MAG TPA: hypothetical protein VEX86_19585 [Longimicrobium sp.]|nr:hypothetical protein [Longimicrobium sp.]
MRRSGPGQPPRLRTALWDVVLPREPYAAVSITLAVALVSAFAIVVRGTAQHPWLMGVLALGLEGLFFCLIFAQPWARRMRRTPRR